MIRSKPRTSRGCFSCLSCYTALRILLMVTNSVLFVGIFTTLVIIDCYDESIIFQQLSGRFDVSPEKVHFPYYQLDHDVYISNRPSHLIMFRFNAPSSIYDGSLCRPSRFMQFLFRLESLASSLNHSV